MKKVLLFLIFVSVLLWGCDNCPADDPDCVQLIPTMEVPDISPTEQPKSDYQGIVPVATEPPQIDIDFLDIFTPTPELFYSPLPTPTATKEY